MMRKTAIATERSDLDRLVCAALKAANANSIDGVERCFDILRYLRDLNLSVKDLCHSKAILPLESLRDHGNTKIRMGANVLLNSWMKTLYSSGRNPSSSSCNKDIPLNLKKPADAVKICSELKKKEHVIAAETKKKTAFLGWLKKDEYETEEIKQIDDCKSFAARPLQTHKQTPPPVKVSENPKYCPSLKSVRDNTCKSTSTKFGLITQKKPDAVQVFSKLKKTGDQRSLTHEIGEIKQNLKRPDDCKPIQAKKQPALPMKLSENPRSLAHKGGEIKRNLMKKQPRMKVAENPKCCQSLKKNSTEMLELFDIAKKSADVANAKGLLLAKAETSICVETLSLLISFPISSTATETRRIMERLAHLTKHKDRKICNSASALLHHWRQSIRDQQQKDARKLKDGVTRESAKDKGRKLTGL